jgi:hypothetical protein
MDDEQQKQFCRRASAEKLIKRSVRVIGTLKEKSGEKERQDVKVSGSMNHQALALTNSTTTTTTIIIIIIIIVVVVDRLQSVKSIIHNRQSRGFDVFASYRK